MKTREGIPADASTLIYLSKADALREAHAAIGVILVPPAVWYEVVEAGEKKGARDPERIRAALDGGLIRRIGVAVGQERMAVKLARKYRLGHGESQVLTMTEKDGDLLMDDRRAKRVAVALGFRPISTISLPFLGYSRGTLDSTAAHELLRRLSKVVGVRADVLLKAETEIWE